MDPQSSWREPMDTLFRGPSAMIPGMPEWNMTREPEKKMILSTYDMTMVAGLAALTYYIVPEKQGKTALGIGLGYLLLKPLAAGLQSSSRTC